MHPYRAFLTGEPGCGKTTVITRVCERLEETGLKLGGMISREIRQGGVRVGFSLEDLLTHETGILAHVNQKDGPRIGKYRVNLSDIERVGAAAIIRAADSSDLVIVDEVGPMELHSTAFIDAVRMALASQKHFIGTIHKRATHRLVTEIRSNTNCEIIELTQVNRDRLPATIVDRLSRHV
jgi:nucleoside-triphosphatase